MKAQVDEHGQVLIPAALPQQLGMRSGDVVVPTIINGEIRVCTMEYGITKAQNIVREQTPPGRDLASELIAERRKEAPEE